MKVLFIGLGSIGQRHLRNLRQLGDFEYHAYRRRGHPLPKEFEDLNIKTHGSLQAALKEGIDLCMIAAPPVVQHEVLPAIVEAGCHFFIEKPIAHCLDGLEELANEISRKNLCTMVGYNLRYHPVHKKIKEVLAAHTLGNISSVRASVGQYLPDWHPHEDYRKGYSARKDLGGGVTLDLIHEIDFVCSLFGHVEEVKGMIAKRSHIEINTEDTSEILLRFTNGILGSVHMDYIQRRPVRNGMIIGDEASLTYDLLKNEVQVLYKDQVDEMTKFNQFNRNDMYMNELKDLLRSIKEGKDVDSNFESGLEVLKIALKAKSMAI